MDGITGKISDEAIASEADMICPAKHRNEPPDDGPCQRCLDHVATMLTVAMEMYEPPWDPEDARHQGFADGWLNAWPAAYRAGREDAARAVEESDALYAWEVVEIARGDGVQPTEEQRAHE